jgi:hypothetical protein
VHRAASPALHIVIICVAVIVVAEGTGANASAIDERTAPEFALFLKDKEERKLSLHEGFVYGVASVATSLLTVSWARLR